MIGLDSPWNAALTGVCMRLAKLLTTTCLCAVMGWAAPSSAAAGPVTYQLDARRSRLFVMVYKDPDSLGAKLSHDHVVAARGWTGQVVWDPEAPRACKVAFTVPVARLDPDPPPLRKRVGLKCMLTEGDRATVKENLLAEDQLWGAKHKTITFVGRTCTRSGAKVTVTGDLTLRGKTRAVTASMKVGIDAKTGQMTASGSLLLRHTWFGFEPYSALGGTLRNKDELRLFIVAKGLPSS